jgi:hypothetical protein
MSRVVWSDGFDEPGGWIETAWKKRDHLDWGLTKIDAHTAPSCLQMKYTYPRIAADRKGEAWLPNSRSIERAITVPPTATHFSIAIKVLSAETEAQLNIQFGHLKTENWEANIDLSSLKRGWQTVEFDLDAMSGYWSETGGRPEITPKFVPSRVSEMMIGGNVNDFEILIDDLQFLEKPRTTTQH